MAGYTKIYCFGGSGGFLGVDGINPIRFQIWLGEGDRQWLEAHYFDSSLSPLGRLRTIVPPSPNHPDSLLDASLAFAPGLFSTCPSLDRVRVELGLREHLDLDAEPALLSWARLREEARETFASLEIWEAELLPLRR